MSRASANSPARGPISFSRNIIGLSELLSKTTRLYMQMTAVLRSCARGTRNGNQSLIFALHWLYLTGSFSSFFARFRNIVVNRHQGLRDRNLNFNRTVFNPSLSYPSYDSDYRYEIGYMRLLPLLTVCDGIRYIRRR